MRSVSGEEKPPNQIGLNSICGRMLPREVFSTGVEVRNENGESFG